MRLEASSRRRSIPGRSAISRAALVAALLGQAACAGRAQPELPAQMQFSAQVREILGADRPTLAYYDARSRLEAMGPEVDAVLVLLAHDPSAKPVARANALILLGDRHSTAALPTFRRILLTEEAELLRSAAVLGLQRLASGSGEAMSLIRSAVSDPARTVRLNALQAIDIRDVATIRAMLEHETDREVRLVAMQLLALAESRGAPLVRDRRGALRTTGPEEDPHIVFRPAVIDPVGGYATGDLRVEMPQGQDIPLAASAEVVGAVVPAFFSSDRSAVVFEAEREVRVMELKTRDFRSLGRGIAPRPIPFTNQFVFLREIPGARRAVLEGTEIRYQVFRATFAEGEPEAIGELRAVATPTRHGNYSPVRWMVVAEESDGFVLRGEMITPFPLPTPIWRPAQPEGRGRRDRGPEEPR